MNHRDTENNNFLYLLFSVTSVPPWLIFLNNGNVNHRDTENNNFLYLLFSVTSVPPWLIFLNNGNVNHGDTEDTENNHFLYLLFSVTSVPPWFNYSCNTLPRRSVTGICGLPSPGSRSRARRSASSKGIFSGIGEMVSGRG